MKKLDTHTRIWLESGAHELIRSMIAMLRSSRSTYDQFLDWPIEDLRHAVRCLSHVLNVPEFKSRRKEMIVMWVNTHARELHEKRLNKIRSELNGDSP